MVQPHIQLEESLNIKYAILPGDPARVSRIAEQMENVEELGFNREYRALRGTYQGVPVLAMSTGMGGASMAIAVEELRNIGITHIVRIGSCGALQEGIGLGDLILVNAAVRDDGASHTYAPDTFPAVADPDLLAGCIRSGREKGFRCHVGLCRSHDSFYIDNNEEVSAAWSKRGVLGSDMETAALFTVARLRGVKAASILNNVVIWGEDTSEAIGSYADGASLTARGERDEITVALEAFVRIEKGETV
jgi:uridine phosphorylase